jgi:hypothetical protein
MNICLNLQDKFGDSVHWAAFLFPIKFYFLFCTIKGNRIGNGSHLDGTKPDRAAFQPDLFYNLHFVGAIKIFKWWGTDLVLVIHVCDHIHLMLKNLFENSAVTAFGEKFLSRTFNVSYRA